MLTPYFRIAPLILVVSIPGWGFAQDQLFFVGDFDHCDLMTAGRNWGGAEVQSPERLRIVTSPTRNGPCAMRITLKPGDGAGGKSKRNRAEIKHNPQVGLGEELYLGYSVFIPEDYDPGYSPIVSQWKLPGGNKVQPTIVVRYGSNNHQVGIQVNYGLKGHNSGQVARTVIQKNQWQDLVMHIKWSTGQDGFIEVWLNGMSITKGKVFGPNMYPRYPAPYHFKVGQYMGKRQIKKPGTLFFDEVRMGKSYEAVAP